MRSCRDNTLAVPIPEHRVQFGNMCGDMAFKDCQASTIGIVCVETRKEMVYKYGATYIGSLKAQVS